MKNKQMKDPHKALLKDRQMREQISKPWNAALAQHISELQFVPAGDTLLLHEPWVAPLPEHASFMKAGKFFAQILKLAFVADVTLNFSLCGHKFERVQQHELGALWFQVANMEDLLQWAVKRRSAWVQSFSDVLIRPIYDFDLMEYYTIIPNGKVTDFQRATAAYEVVAEGAVRILAEHNVITYAQVKEALQRVEDLFPTAEPS